MNRLLLANALGIKPLSTNFRDLLSCSFKYGLTLGTEKAENIELTDLGKKITQPLSEAQRNEAKKQAVLTPELFSKVYSHYQNNKFPQGDFFKNTLEVTFNVSREFSEEAVSLLLENGKYTGIIRDISGSLYVMLNGSEESDPDLGENTELEIEENQQEILAQEVINPEEESKSNILKPIFIAHGKDRQPLTQLEKILNQFGIPHKVAIHEAHSGRPVSQKVRDTMHECGSAIFIFSSKDEATDGDSNIVQPNANVVFELGAASVLYGEKVIIFKEDGVNLPSDFSDLGYINFPGGALEAKAMDLLKELIAMGFVKIMPA